MPFFFFFCRMERCDSGLLVLPAVSSGLGSIAGSEEISQVRLKEKKKRFMATSDWKINRVTNNVGLQKLVLADACPSNHNSSLCSCLKPINAYLIFRFTLIVLSFFFFFLIFHLHVFVLALPKTVIIAASARARCLGVFVVPGQIRVVTQLTRRDQVLDQEQNA